MSCRSASPRPWSLDHLAAGDLRARRRHHRPGAAHDVRPPRRDDGALAGDLRAGHLPGRRPARLDQPDPRPAVRRRGALQRRAAREGDPAALQGPAGHHRDPRHRRAVRRGQGHRARARRIQRFLSQPFFVAEQFTGIPGKFTPVSETITSFKAIADGDYDHLPEQAFFMCGGIEDAEEKAKASRAARTAEKKPKAEEGEEPTTKGSDGRRRRRGRQGRRRVQNGQRGRRREGQDR